MTHEPDLPERDATLDAAWREHSTEQPPAALDAAILAAAHRAVGSRPQGAGSAAAEAPGKARAATRPPRWWMPLAAAATIGVVTLGILQTLPQQDSVTTPTASDAPARARQPASSASERPSNVHAAPPPAPAPASTRDESPAAGRMQAPAVAAAVTAEPVAPPATSVTDRVAQKSAPSLAAPEAQRAAAPAPQPFPAEKKAESMESDVKDRARMAPKLATAPAVATEAASDVAPAPPAAAAPMSESARADVRQRNEAPPAAPLASGAVALGKTAARMDAAAAPAVDVDAWIARIRKLHDEGRLADAAKELVAMRTAVPDADARLPRELRAWAATVKP